MADWSVACAVIRITGVSGEPGARRGEQLDAGDVRHPDVGEHHVGRELGEHLEPLPPAVRGVRLEPLVAEQDAEGVEDPALVVDHEDAGLV
jgi:hypothetical protein